MPYDPDKHNRRSIRLSGYDYTRAGAYFITICTYDRVCLFGEVVQGTVHLSRYGRIVLGRWRALPRHFSRIRLDAFVVMPNHVHGILVIKPRSSKETPAANGNGRGEASDRSGRRVLSGDAEPDLSDDTFPADASPLRGADHPTGTTPGSLGAVLQNVKSTATRKINRLRGTPGEKVWQRGYYDRILRNARERDAARRYIEENPARWDEDRNNQTRL